MDKAKGLPLDGGNDKIWGVNKYIVYGGITLIGIAILFGGYKFLSKRPVV